SAGAYWVGVVALIDGWPIAHHVWVTVTAVTVSAPRHGPELMLDRSPEIGAMLPTLCRRSLPTKLACACFPLPSKSVEVGMDDKSQLARFGHAPGRALGIRARSAHENQWNVCG